MRRRGRVIRIGLVCLWCFVAATPLHAESSSLTSFHLPAQPLGAALTAYGEQSGSEGLYDTSLSNGKVSTEVNGPLDPAEALHRLLTGTGLTARFLSNKAYVLLPAQAGAIEQGARPAAHRFYYALVQHSLLAALCRSDEARPGSYLIKQSVPSSSGGSFSRNVMALIRSLK
ncbi:STN domain-containing protein [Rhodopseudomonas boonkerdii]|uniref:STN domain-containing protein n=1 Tax=Rhodopseudomonas boonkerdii TaxID=475937 RepID=UPI0032218733